MVAAGCLNLRVAMSRDAFRPKQYVQDLMAEDKRMLAELFVQRAGVAYVCGSAKRIGAGVHDALRQIVQMLPEQVGDADEWLDQASQEGRYQRDVWG